MKIEEKQGNIKRIGNVGEEITSFTLEATSKAFEILSSSIYSDKIYAILRELGTNAFDSHVEAGKKDVPFEVHLPSKMNPIFYVRDYGTGLEHEKAMTLYRSYFSSDKSHSNDFDGCLGLGSKSPLSYTDCFTVESYINGEKRSYRVFISEDRIPQLEYLGKCDTKEKNGLKVELSVNNKDVYEFNQKASEVYSWFSTKPLILNSSTQIRDFNYSKDKFVIKEKDFWVIKKDGYSYSSAKNHLIMGNVCYNLELDKMFKDNIDDNIVRDINKNNDILIWAERGDVDILPSREGLQYTKKTIEFLKSKISFIEDNFREIYQDKINKCENVYDARKEVYYLFENDRALYHLLTKKNNYFKWKNQILYDSHIPIYYSEDKKMFYSEINLDKKEKEKFKKAVIAKSYDFVKGNVYGRNKYSKIRADKDSHLEYIPLRRNVVFFINDEDKQNFHDKIVYHLDSSGYTGNEVIVISQNPDSKVSLKGYLKYSGIEHSCTYLSNIKVPKEEIEKIKNKRKTPKLLLFKNPINRSRYYDSSAKRDYWKDVDVKLSDDVLEDGGVYVFVNRFDWSFKKDDKGFNAPFNLEEIVSTLVEFKPNAYSDIKNKLYGIRSSAKDFFDDYDNWISLEEYIKKLIKKEFCEESIKEIVNLRTVSHFGNNNNLYSNFYGISTLMKLFDKKVDIPKDISNIFEKMKNLIVERESNESKLKETSSKNTLVKNSHLSNYFQKIEDEISEKTSKNIDKIEAVISEFSNLIELKYKLLETIKINEYNRYGYEKIIRSFNSSDVDHLALYLNAVDQIEKENTFEEREVA